MPTIRDIGIPQVGPGILQPKLTHKFRVTFSKLGLPLNPTDVSLQVISITRPKLSFAEVPLHRYNSRGWIAGKHDWAACTVIYEDDITSRASAVIREQITRQQKLIGAQAGPWLASAPDGSSYKFGLVADMLDGDSRVLESWKYEGCWIQDADYGTMQYESSDPVKVTLLIRFDHAYEEIYNYDPESKGQSIGGDAPTSFGIL